MCTRPVLAALTLTAAIAAQPPSVQISIGIRETEAGGGSAFSAIGGNGGASGGIEWVNLDGQSLVLDGTWQQFTFNITTDTLTGFAGTTANNVLEGTYGTLEHIRVLNGSGVTDPMSLWVDDVTNTTNSGGPTVFGDFEGFADGDEVMFQEPTFSGSTSGNIVAGATSGVDNLVASRSASCRFDLQFIDNTATRWVRLTSFSATNIPNPQIRFDDGSVITFWMRGGDCQPSLGGQGPGNAIAELCGEGLNSGEASAYHVANAPAGALGALGISTANQPDLSIFGGTLISGLGLVSTFPLAANPAGSVTLPVPGSASMIDLVLQSAFVDASQPANFTFTNAVQASFGQ